MRLPFIISLLSIITSTTINAQIPFPNPGKVFNDDIIPRVYVSIDEGDLDELYNTLENEDHYPVSVIFDNGTNPDTLENVGLRFRGNTSLYSDKKSFKLSFNTFEPGRKYKGLEKMNINGEHNDPSVIRSKLCWDLCRQMGIPASRSNHVELYINNIYWGLYINVEHVDEEFVDLRFGNDIGNLYKCLWPATLEYLGTNPDLYKLESGGRRIYDLKTNTAEDDYSDIAQFIYILNNTSNENLPCELEKVFDVQNYLKVIAMDVLTANWDGPIFNKNNFYLYSNPQTGKIHYLPYDLDNTFGIQWFGEWTERNIYDWAPGGEPRPIYTKIMANDHYRAQYTYYMEEFLDLYFNEDGFFDAIDARKNMIESSIPDDPLYPLDYGFDINDFNNSYTEGISANHVPLGLKEYASLRMTSAFNQLESTNAAPIITELNVQSVTANQDIFIRVKIEDTESVNAMVQYEFEGEDGQATLYDDGQHNDGAAGDQIFGAKISAFEESGTLNYYIEASDASNNNNRYPYCETFSIELLENSFELYINEFQANNESTVADENDEYDDWIEIYNGSSQTINLNEFFLSDNLTNPTKWNFPDHTLEAGGFLVIWADDDPGTFHANFKLNADGEEIILSNSFGNPIDHVTFGRQDNDETTGRIPNGIGIMQAVSPTPGASNEPATAIHIPLTPEFTILPNPVRNDLFVSAITSIDQVTIYDLPGQLILNKEIKNTETNIEMSSLNPGIYILTIYFENGQTISEKIIKQ